MANETISYSKQGRNSWSFEYTSNGACMQVALVSGKAKARRVLSFLESADLSGKSWEEVAIMIRDFRIANKLTLSDPHPRARA